MKTGLHERRDFLLTNLQHLHIWWQRLTSSSASTGSSGQVSDFHDQGDWPGPACHLKHTGNFLLGNSVLDSVATLIFIQQIKQSIYFAARNLFQSLISILHICAWKLLLLPFRAEK